MSDRRRCWRTPTENLLHHRVVEGDDMHRDVGAFGLADDLAGERGS
jgi:hypothetical protein